VKAKIHVTLKQGILDPQGKAIEHALDSLGFKNAANVRVGKYMGTGKANLREVVGEHDHRRISVRVDMMYPGVRARVLSQAEPAVLVPCPVLKAAGFRSPLVLAEGGTRDQSYVQIAGGSFDMCTIETNRVVPKSRW
jgi:phosphoribosylformylglycinamidine synthase PurS subunit